LKKHLLALNSSFERWQGGSRRLRRYTFAISKRGLGISIHILNKLVAPDARMVVPSVSIRCICTVLSLPYHYGLEERWAHRASISLSPCSLGQKSARINCAYPVKSCSYNLTLLNVPVRNAVKWQSRPTSHKPSPSCPRETRCTPPSAQCLAVARL
jgi:hypothetical protein